LHISRAVFVRLQTLDIPNKQQKKAQTVSLIAYLELMALVKPMTTNKHETAHAQGREPIANLSSRL